jgi:hypothetical protein
MKHSRNLVRLVILLTLISIGLFHMPGGGLQAKASASKAPGAPPSAVVPSQIFWNSPPRVGVNSDGRLEVFVVGLDGGLWHNWQVTPTSVWSGWYTLGGSLLGKVGVNGGGLAVDRNAYGALEVFAVWTDHSLRHNWQLTPGGAWSGWVSLGGAVYNEPAIARYSDGRLEVFATGLDVGHLLHIWQLKPAGAWSGWDSLLAPAGDFIIDSPSVAMNAYGFPEVFVETYSTETVWHIWLNPGGPWSGWNDLGGSDSVGRAVTSNPDGRLEVFSFNSGASHSATPSLLHRWQESTTGGWSGWDSLGVGITGGPVVARNTDGRLIVFARGSNSDLVHARQLPGGGWSSLQSLSSQEFTGGILHDWIGVARNAGGGLEVFIIGDDGKVWHKWQISSGWSSWFSL